MNRVQCCHHMQLTTTLARHILLMDDDTSSSVCCVAIGPTGETGHLSYYLEYYLRRVRFEPPPLAFLLVLYVLLSSIVPWYHIPSPLPFKLRARASQLVKRRENIQWAGRSEQTHKWAKETNRSLRVDTSSFMSPEWEFFGEFFSHIERHIAACLPWPRSNTNHTDSSPIGENLPWRLGKHSP